MTSACRSMNGTTDPPPDRAGARSGPHLLDSRARLPRRRLVMLTAALVIALGLTVAGLAVSFWLAFAAFVAAFAVGVSLEAEIRVVGREKLGNLPINAWLAGSRREPPSRVTSAASTESRRASTQRQSAKYCRTRWVGVSMSAAIRSTWSRPQVAVVRQSCELVGAARERVRRRVLDEVDHLGQRRHRAGGDRECSRPSAAPTRSWSSPGYRSRRPAQRRGRRESTPRRHVRVARHAGAGGAARARNRGRERGRSATTTTNASRNHGSVEPRSCSHEWGRRRRCDRGGVLGVGIGEVGPGVGAGRTEHRGGRVRRGSLGALCRCPVAAARTRPARQASPV